MRLYIAGMYTSGTADRQGRLYTELMDEQERQIVEACRYQLESYHYIKNPDRAAIIRRDGARVFLDSGAFSGRRSSTGGGRPSSLANTTTTGASGLFAPRESDADSFR